MILLLACWFFAGLLGITIFYMKGFRQVDAVGIVMGIILGLCTLFLAVSETPKR